MCELAGKVVVGLDGLHEVRHGTCQAVAFASLDPRDLTDGDYLDGYRAFAVTDMLDAQLVDARILGVKELCCLDPGRIGDIRHPVWESVGVV